MQTVLDMLCSPESLSVLLTFSHQNTGSLNVIWKKTVLLVQQFLSLALSGEFQVVADKLRQRDNANHFQV